MFLRIVSVDGTEVAIPCSPETPYSDILRRAADILAGEEGENYAADLSGRLSRYSEREVIA